MQIPLTGENVSGLDVDQQPVIHKTLSSILDHPRWQWHYIWYVA